MKKKKLKKHHDLYRTRNLNLTGVFEAFTDEEKAVMMKAWGLYYSSISLAVLPFANRAKMRVAVNDFYIDLSKMDTTDIALEQSILNKLKVL